MARETEHTGFHPVIPTGDRYQVLDLSHGYDPSKISLDPPAIGRYHERRGNMYTSAIFQGKRNIHMGLDFWVPSGTPVYAFSDGELLFFRNNDRYGDYGPTLVTSHSGVHIRKILQQIAVNDPGAASSGGSGLSGGNHSVLSNPEQENPEQEKKLYALYGHLSVDSLQGLESGMKVRKGQILGTVGDFHENGGWAPHLHLQLSIENPGKADMPGVVAESELPDAIRRYPDPQWITGRFY